MIDIGLPWVLVSALPYVVVQTAADIFAKSSA